jgi:uncharacterized iron-regulated membrane protein
MAARGNRGASLGGPSIASNPERSPFPVGKLSPVNSTRAVFRVHSWLGLIAGALMFVIVLSGVFLVYRAELDRFFNPEIRTRPLAAHPVPIDAMLRSARAQFPAYNIGYLMFPVDAQSPLVAYLREVVPGGEVIRHQVYLDVGTGAVVGHRLSYHFLADWMVRVHDCLWLPERWGEPLVALLGVVLALLGLTGLWVYRKKVGEALRWHRSARRLGRLHAHVGVWALLFAILLGVTGTVLNYRSLLVLAHRAPPTPLEGVAWQALDRMPSVDALVAESRRVFPELEARYVYFPRSGPSNTSADFIKVSGFAPGRHVLGASSYVTFAVSPVVKVLGSYDGRQAPWSKRLRFTITALHYGDFAGHLSKSVYVFGGLALTFLAASGLWIGLRPRRRPAVLATGAAAAATILP